MVRHRMFIRLLSLCYALVAGWLFATGLGGLLYQTDDVSIWEFERQALAQTGGQKILRVAEDSLPGGLNPLTVFTMVERRTSELVHDGPFKAGETGEPEASLIALDAQNQPMFDIMPDGRTATGALRRATFHDGKAVTVEDLRLSIAAYDAASDRYLANDFFKGLVDSVTPQAGDPQHQFKMVMNRQLKNPRWALNIKVMPRAGFKNGQDVRTWASDSIYALRPSGAGPFKLDPSSTLAYNAARLSLIAHQAYYRGRPKLDGIELIGVPSTTEKLQQLRAGQIHLIVALSRSEQVTAKSIRDIDTVAYPLRNWWYLGYNCNQKPLESAKVRRALSKIVDRRALGKRIGDVFEPATAPKGGSIPVGPNTERMKNASVVLLSGPFVSDSPYYNGTVPQPQVDPIQARQELMETGLFNMRENKLYVGASPFTLELAYDKGLPDSDDIVVQLRQDFMDAGIKLNVSALDSIDWDRKVDPRYSESRSQFDLFLGRFTFDNYDDIMPIFAPDGRLNLFRYKSGQLAAVFDKFRVEPDFERRANLMMEAHRLIAEDMPCLFLWQSNQIAAVSQSVRAVKIHSFRFYINPHMWSLQE